MEKTKETYKTFQKGQLIIKEGQLNPLAFMVKRGRVFLYRVINNRRVIISQLKPGQIFGEIALILGQPFYANAEAAETTELIAVDRQFLQSLIVKSPNPVRRIIRQLLEQLRATHDLIQEQPCTDLFLSVCQVLELCCAASEGSIFEAGQQPVKNALSYLEFCRVAKNILVIAQLELDEIIETLRKINLVQIRDIKDAVYKRDIFGQLNREGELLRDRIIILTDRRNFMTAARNLRREMRPDDGENSTSGLEFVDIHDLAALAGTTPAILYRLLARQELPEGLFFFPRSAILAWLGEQRSDFFVRSVSRDYGALSLRYVDDVVNVPDITLQYALNRLNQRNVHVLYAAAGEQARKKLLANLSKKRGEDILFEGADLVVEYAELADAENELFDLVRAVRLAESTGAQD